MIGNDEIRTILTTFKSNCYHACNQKKLKSNCNHICNFEKPNLTISITTLVTFQIFFSMLNKA